MCVVHEQECCINATYNYLKTEFNKDIERNPSCSLSLVLQIKVAMEEMVTESFAIETGDDNASTSSSVAKETPQSQPDDKVSQIST